MGELYERVVKGICEVSSSKEAVLGVSNKQGLRQNDVWFSSRRRHKSWPRDWCLVVCSFVFSSLFFFFFLLPLRLFLLVLSFLIFFFVLFSSFSIIGRVSCGERV